MRTLRLADADRERLNVPTEWIPLDLLGVTNREAIELAKLGFATPFIWREALPSTVDQIDILAWTGAVWLALKRVGVHTDITELEFDMERLDTDPGEEPSEEPDSGKVDSPTSTNGDEPSSMPSGT